MERKDREQMASELCDMKSERQVLQQKVSSLCTCYSKMQYIMELWM